MRAIGFLVLATIGSFLTVGPACGQEPPNKPARLWLAELSKGWNESKWEKNFRTSPGPYIRPLDDTDWKLRVLALRGVVSGGDASIPALIEALKSDSPPMRIFAAQALGYLAPNVPTEPLLAAAKNDPDAAVRLYAVDALGAKGDSAIDFDALLQTEKSIDVRKHLNYAKERKGQPIDASVARQLVEWNPGTIDTANVDRAAPDFALTAATGERVKLSDFKGKSAVVLVFVYGDT